MSRMKREVVKASPIDSSDTDTDEDMDNSDDEYDRHADEPIDSEEILNEKSHQLLDMMKQSKHTIVYTGAGISTACKIPDYRGPNGVYTLARKGVEAECDSRMIAHTPPSETHQILKELYRQGYIKHFVSQNCDGLHLRSGIPQHSLSEIHGNMFIEVCEPCGKQFIRNHDVTEDSRFRQHQTKRKCTSCKGFLKDTIVHFGEHGKAHYPMNWKAATKNAKEAELIIVIGSSLHVMKSYDFLWPTPQSRTKLVIINLQWTPKDSVADLVIRGKCDDVMRRLSTALDFPVLFYCRECDPVLNRKRNVRQDEPIMKLTSCICSVRIARGVRLPAGIENVAPTPAGWWTSTLNIANDYVVKRDRRNKQEAARVAKEKKRQEGPSVKEVLTGKQGPSRVRSSRSISSKEDSPTQKGNKRVHYSSDDDYTPGPCAQRRNSVKDSVPSRPRAPPPPPVVRDREVFTDLMPRTRSSGRVMELPLVSDFRKKRVSKKAKKSPDPEDEIVDVVSDSPVEANASADTIGRIGPSAVVHDPTPTCSKTDTVVDQPRGLLKQPIAIQQKHEQPIFSAGSPIGPAPTTTSTAPSGSRMEPVSTPQLNSTSAKLIPSTTPLKLFQPQLLTPSPESSNSLSPTTSNNTTQSPSSLDAQCSAPVQRNLTPPKSPSRSSIAQSALTSSQSASDSSPHSSRINNNPGIPDWKDSRLVMERDLAQPSQSASQSRPVCQKRPLSERPRSPASNQQHLESSRSSSNAVPKATTRVHEQIRRAQSFLPPGYPDLPTAKVVLKPATSASFPFTSMETIMAREEAAIRNSMTVQERVCPAQEPTTTAARAPKRRMNDNTVDLPTTRDAMNSLASISSMSSLNYSSSLSSMTPSMQHSSLMSNRMLSPSMMATLPNGIPPAMDLLTSMLSPQYRPPSMPISAQSLLNQSLNQQPINGSQSFTRDSLTQAFLMNQLSSQLGLRPTTTFTGNPVMESSCSRVPDKPPRRKFSEEEVDVTGFDEQEREVHSFDSGIADLHGSPVLGAESNITLANHMFTSQDYRSSLQSSSMSPYTQQNVQRFSQNIPSSLGVFSSLAPQPFSEPLPPPSQGLIPDDDLPVDSEQEIYDQDALLLRTDDAYLPNYEDGAVRLNNVPEPVQEENVIPRKQAVLDLNISSPVRRKEEHSEHHERTAIKPAKKEKESTTRDPTGGDSIKRKIKNDLKCLIRMVDLVNSDMSNASIHLAFKPQVDRINAQYDGLKLSSSLLLMQQARDETTLEEMGIFQLPEKGKRATLPREALSLVSKYGKGVLFC